MITRLRCIAWITLQLTYGTVHGLTRYPTDVVNSLTSLLGREGLGATLDAVHHAARPIVFDVGMNDGKDARYFTQQGYTVISVDANPDLISASHVHSKDLLDGGKLVVLHAGIEESVSEPLTFYKNMDVDVWSSFDRSKACQGSAKCEAINVPLLRCEALWAFGRPTYLKVDIEERHYTCIRSLRNVPQHLLPTYVSWEMHDFADGRPYPILDSQLITMLYDMGYRTMKVAEQLDGASTTAMPEDAVHYKDLSTTWKPVEEVLSIGLTNPRESDYFSGWFDFIMRLNVTAPSHTPVRRHS